MKYWKANRYAFLDAHPYKGPYDREEDAVAWAAQVQAVHADRFDVIKTERGYEVVQDVAK